MPALAAEAPVGLGTLYGFGAVAGSTITNTGPTTIGGSAGGDIGVYPGLAVTGFPPGIISGAIQTGNLGAQWAQEDLTRAYNDAAGRSTTADLTGQDLGGKTLVSGVYSYASSAQLTGELTLDGQGDFESVFVFKIGTTLTTASNSRIRFINGAEPCRVFWQVGSSATLGTDSEFAGTLMALTSITANTGASVNGRLLARNAAVTLDTNAITNDWCTSMPTTATLHVIKHVVNDSGGTAVASDFNLHVMTGGVDVSGSPARGAELPGTTYKLQPGTYIVSEDASAAYQTSYFQDGGDELDVDALGAHISLGAGQEMTITVTNADVEMPRPPQSFTVTKTADPAGGTRVSPGQIIEYRLTYANSSDTTETHATLLDTLGAEVTYQLGTLLLNGVPITDAGHYDAATRAISVDVGPVPPKTSGVLAFKVTVGPWDVSRVGFANTSTWSASSGASGTTAPVYHYVDSLDITKEVLNRSGTVVRTGSVLLWRIHVRNNGIEPARNVVVTDVVPAGTTYVKGSMSFKNVADDSDAPNLRWDVGTIDVGETVMLTFQTRVKDTISDGTVISNKATVRSDVSPTKSATATSTPVVDTPTIPVNTAGAEGATLGLMSLLAALTLGFTWSGRNPALRSARPKRIAASVLLSSVLLLGVMEVGSIYGLPSPGEAISSAAESAAPAAGQRTIAAASGSSVSIPSIGVRVRLVEGKSMKALAQGVWRQPTSVRPGQRGTSVIAGHRVPKQFRSLKNVRVGASVLVTSGGKVHKYRVVSVSTKKAGKGLVFRMGIKEQLILYTCVPKWQGDKRTVVVCVPVSR